MERLTQQEEEVMIYFWKMGPSFIREIVNEMPEPKPPYTSVASVVRNLEKKKFLSPFKLGNSIQYHVLVKESDYKRSFMNGVVSNYFYRFVQKKWFPFLSAIVKSARKNSRI